MFNFILGNKTIVSWCPEENHRNMQKINDLKKIVNNVVCNNRAHDLFKTVTNRYLIVQIQLSIKY